MPHSGMTLGTVPPLSTLVSLLLRFASEIGKCCILHNTTFGTVEEAHLGASNDDMNVRVSTTGIR